MFLFMNRGYRKLKIEIGITVDAMEVFLIFLEQLLPARASEQGNVIGSVRIIRELR